MTFLTSFLDLLSDPLKIYDMNFNINYYAFVVLTPLYSNDENQLILGKI
jgi:hypothetical protein